MPESLRAHVLLATFGSHFPEYASKLTEEDPDLAALVRSAPAAPGRPTATKPAVHMKLLEKLLKRIGIRVSAETLKELQRRPRKSRRK
jgi:hypothetical protein